MYPHHDYGKKQADDFECISEPCGEEGHYFDGSCYYLSNMVALQWYEAEVDM